MTKREMVFNIHFDYLSHSGSASAQRPGLILEAFKSIGYTVCEVTGSWAERQAGAQKVIARVEKGWRPAFLYVESSTAPHMLESKYHLPKRSYEMDMANACARHKIPCGLFYRDIHWRFNRPKEVKQRLILSYYTPFYKREWKAYTQIFDCIFLPTLEMARHLPSSDAKSISALPPAQNTWVSANRESRGALRLAYVGGLTKPGTIYSLENILAAIKGMDVEFWLCCRKREFHKVKQGYAGLLGEQVRVIHPSPDEVPALMSQCDIGVSLFDPHPYHEFAFPYKVFEYLGSGLPVITSEGTSVGSFILERDLGWVLPANLEEIRSCIMTIIHNRSQIDKKKSQIAQHASINTWAERARMVERKLLNR